MRLLAFALGSARRFIPSFRHIFLSALSFQLSALSLAFANAAPTVVVAVGAPGESQYGTNFVEQATLWKEAAARAGAKTVIIGLEPTQGTNDLGRLAEVLISEPQQEREALWLVFIGHGTFDGREAKFNLKGPDLGEAQLAELLLPFRRPLVVINTTAASAPFLKRLSATNRVVVTATRSGNEMNYARFGHYLARTLSNPEADLDKDGQVSVLEGFLTASRQAVEFYKLEGRLATEHALIDDNADGLGTPADWFQGLRVRKQSSEGKAVDGLFARQLHLVPSESERLLNPEQRARRDDLERAVFLHREKRDQMPEEAYYRELEVLLLDLARFYAGLKRQT